MPTPSMNLKTANENDIVIGPDSNAKELIIVPKSTKDSVATKPFFLPI